MKQGNTLLDTQEQTEPQAIGPVATVPPAGALVFERFLTDPGVDVEKLERLMGLWERVEARKSEEQYNAAMAAAQREMRPVATDAENPQTRSRYASYEALDRAIRPIYTNRGFGLSFYTDESPKLEHVRVCCKVSHAAGHCERPFVDMPADGKGAKGGDVMTKTHAMGAALSYGMRYLLKMIFNIAVGEDDDDGNSNGGASRPEASAPEGYDAWLAILEGMASEGMPAFSQAWNKSKEEYRKHLARTAPKLLAGIKSKAAKAGAR